jgi:hypothetical protein
MIMMHSAPARHAAHRLAELFPGRMIETNNYSNFTPRLAADAAGPARDHRPRLACPSPALQAGPASLCPALLYPALIRLALPRVPPRGEDRACPLSHARAAALPGRRRLLRGGPGVPHWDAPARADWAGPPKARLPLTVAGDGRAPPAAAADPPRASTGPGPPRSLAFTLPAAAPGGSPHLSPPELRPIGERMEFMWRIPRHRGGTFRRAGPNDHRSYRGRRCRRPGASGRRGRRSQVDAARTRPPSPPKLVRAAQPLPCTGPRQLHMPRISHMSRISVMITPVSSRFW